MNKTIDNLPEEIADCPVYKTIEIFQGKWNALILFELGRHETMRFNQLRKAIPGISNTVLMNALRNLERMGLVKREQFNEIPPHVEYSSTESARELKDVFTAMKAWGEKYL
ncbi:MAG: winged helix-turn-helix transcriptional regulator [Candidatus Coproplasma sp.]